MSLQRLDQCLSSLGYCSRGEAKAWLRDERVCVNGQPISDSACKVDPAQVSVDGEALDHPDGIAVMLHKPLGLVCSHREPGRSIYECFPARWRQRRPQPSSAGRLDKDSSGLLIVSTDGALLHQLTSPKRHVGKVYAVTLAEPLRGDEVQRLAAGDLLLEDDDTPCLPAELQIIGAQQVQITLYEGRYHQVRRMFAALGNHVSALQRSAIGGLTLGDLPPGAWRDLAPQDLALLRQ